MQGDINLTPEAVATCVATIREVVANISEYSDNIQALAGQIPESWIDNNSQEFISNLSELKKQIDQCCVSVEEFATSLQNTSNVIEATHNEGQARFKALGNN